MYIAFAATVLNHGIIAVADPLAEVSKSVLPSWFALTTAQMILACEVLYLVEQILLKASLAIFFLRIVTVTWQRRVFQALICFYELYTLALFFCVLFADGRPTGHNILLGSASNPDFDHALFGPLNYIQTVLNIVVDITFTMIPIFVVSKALMPLREKISISVLILIAALGSIVSIARLPYIPIIVRDNTSIDFPGIEALGLISLGEATAGIVAISLATTRPLFKKWLEKTRTSRATKSGTGKAGDSKMDTSISRRIDIDVEEEVIDVWNRVGGESLFNDKGMKMAPVVVRAF